MLWYNIYCDLNPHPLVNIITHHCSLHMTNKSSFPENLSFPKTKFPDLYHASCLMFHLVTLVMLFLLRLLL